VRGSDCLTQSNKCIQVRHKAHIHTSSIHDQVAWNDLPIRPERSGPKLVGFRPTAATQL